ncbi:rho guanine nucleotide exchange factor 26-like [Periophthalmus magnuspinnatus]|uniref:rho guanine nucleotide exchange factor 26-like n=1 Tax=Periophthalmus magnuspinnatus TaxID=409849 RepID=UPI00145B69D6|nr:rho guanine nucleotide exchange factor 26-like [Periophthalmus magnuspinnatus]XP_055081939.1 rho guanine nucleotide exchange factor 26-like [Periophthalmus magnuspinnatus]
MDYGNDVDLSNNNITPLWRRRSDNCRSPQISRNAKPRPVSYHINGVMTTDFPVEDKCSFTLSQPDERILVTPTPNTAVLKHVLNKPTKKNRVVRSISIGHFSNGRFSLPKFRSEDNRSASLDNRICNGGSDKGKYNNGMTVWPEKKWLSGQLSLNSQKEALRTSDIHSSLSPPQTPNGNSYEELSSSSSNCSPLCRTPTPSHSSTSSIPSLSSLNSSDPPTPRSSSPDRTQSKCSVSESRHSSSSSTSPSISPSPHIVLSTNSPAARKMGTQQIIPKGLACEVRQSKVTSPTGTQGQGLAALLGLDNAKRSTKALSMVETGAYFSTGVQKQEEGDGDSPGTLRRGLRSTSYRKAVVSGVDEVDNVFLEAKSLQLSPAVVKGLNREKTSSNSPASSPASNASATPTSPKSPGTPKLFALASPKTTKPSSPRTAKPSGKIKLSPEKKNVLTSQRTFDSEEEELYQNYQEKALHNDSDEDADSREPKPDNNIVVQYKPLRTSWSQLSVVKKSGLSERLSQEERKRQEAIFEVISSEHSYLHSLEILIRMFKNSTELSEAMTKTEHHHLFSNITDVCEASKKFFSELEERHQQSIVIHDISDIVCKHAQSNFDPYITYCSNEVYQQRTLQRLVSKNPAFKEVLTRIESHPDCRNLPMISFLILPMQRITRLPLLMDTICHKTLKDSAEYEKCKKALQAVSKVVRKCNEGARTMERTEMMYTINSQLEFKIKPFPLVSSSRWMVKRGELTAFVEDSGIFLKRTSRQQVYFFLFNDVLIVTKKKSEESYTVIDYALRDEIWVGSCQPEDVSLSPVRSAPSMLSSKQGSTNHLFRLTFRSNHSGEKVLMILGTDSLNERARWISALGQSVNNKKSLDRNAMQVEAIRTYTAKQPDELSLQVADVVLISQTVDGWYEGERLRDGERGWFLLECTQPITCQATIERNMQRMDRLQGLETNV